MNICKFCICIYSLKIEYYSERILIVAREELLRAGILRMLDDLPRLLNSVVDRRSRECVDRSDNIVIALEALRGARVVFKSAVNIDQPAVLFSEPVQLRLEPRFVFLTDAPYFARYRTVRADTERRQPRGHCRGHHCLRSVRSVVKGGVAMQILLYHFPILRDRGLYDHDYRSGGRHCQVYKKELT